MRNLGILRNQYILYIFKKNSEKTTICSGMQSTNHKSMSKKILKK